QLFLLKKYLGSLRFFSKDHYDKGELLHRLSTTMAAVIHKGKLAERVMSILCTQMKVSSAALVFVKNGRIVDKTVRNTPPPILTKGELDLFNGREKPIMFEELPEGKRKALLRRLNVSIVLPLHTKDQTVGLLMLGPKSSGDIYYSQDLDIFAILAPEFAVALENAEGVERIRRFNITLQEEVRKATENLTKANSRLRELDKLKDEFVSMASHDLATPLSAVKGYLWMLQKKHPTPKERIGYLEHAAHATDRLLALVNDMLDVSRIEGGRILLKPEKIYLPKLVLEVKEELAPKLSSGKATLTIQADKAYIACADRAKIHQVFVNLVSNAIKYSPNGGTIVVAFMTDKDKMIQTSVADAGIGMKENEMDTLFTKFGRLSNAGVGSSQIPGTGLGLYICKKIVELSGGKIWAESQEGKGSTFFFTLPKA
ncbi:MAG: ATP-binding protein, partial [bacterium]|nr:ATP-binding protein [bacterium]